MDARSPEVVRSRPSTARWGFCKPTNPMAVGSSHRRSHQHYSPELKGPSVLSPSFWFSGCWRELAKGTAWAFFSANQHHHHHLAHSAQAARPFAGSSRSAQPEIAVTPPPLEFYLGAVVDLNRAPPCVATSRCFKQDPKRDFLSACPPWLGNGWPK